MPRFPSTRLIVYLLALTMADLCFMSARSMFTFRPVLLYLMILYAAYEWRGANLLRLSILIGFSRDLLGSQPLGVETAALLFCAAILKLSLQKIERHWFVTRLATAALFVFFVSFLILIFSSLLGAGGQISGYTLWVCLSSALSSALVMPVFFLVTRKWFHDKIPLKQFELFGH